MVQFPPSMLLNLSPTWMGMCFPITWAFLTSFYGVPYPAWYTERQKSRHGAIETAVPYPYSEAVCRTRTCEHPHC